VAQSSPETGYSHETEESSEISSDCDITSSGGSSLLEGSDDLDGDLCFGQLEDILCWGGGVEGC